MSTEQSVSGPLTTSASAYPSTSLPPTHINDPPSSTTNGAQAENGTHSLESNASPVNETTGSMLQQPTSTVYYTSKLPNSNGQTRKNSHPALSNHNSNPSPSEQMPINFIDTSNSTPPQQLHNDHSPNFIGNQNDGFQHSNDQPSTTVAPTNAYKAQITTTSLKPSKNLNGGDKTPTQNDQIEPSTSTTSATNSKNTPKASQPKNRTPARTRQKAANTNSEPRPRSGTQNAANNAANASGQPTQAAGTKRPHPNQYTYQQHTTAPKDNRAAAYPRYNNSVTISAGSTQVHPQQVHYSVPPSSNYPSPKIYVQSQSSSTVSSPYALQRSGTSSLAGQRSGVQAGSSQVIIQCRPDQQASYSQGQSSNQHFIIQTQQTSDQPPTVYQRPGGGRPEIQRQYIQTIPNGPPAQTSVSSGQGQQSSGQPQVLHIQLHHSDMPGQQKLLIQQQPTSTVQQSDRQGTSASSSVHPHHLPPTAQQQMQRSKNVRTLLAQPPMAIKGEEMMFDEMHPAHLPLPDSYNTLLDQIHASGESPKTFYRRLKKQFKYLVYENECYQEELRNSQRHLLKLSRDKNFLLDRLLNYESADEASEDSDADSDATIEEKPKPKKKKVQPPRKRNPAPSTSKKGSAKTLPKVEDENSQCSVDSTQANSQSADLLGSNNNVPASGDNKH
ncbi:INO80 complex subunit E [Aphelenchoides bicaudatus]|nr:INO80 complex subunit E [Aphelenchoides bicaudatus]